MHFQLNISGLKVISFPYIVDFSPSLIQGSCQLLHFPLFIFQFPLDLLFGVLEEICLALGIAHSELVIKFSFDVVKPLQVEWNHR